MEQNQPGNGKCGAEVDDEEEAVGVTADGGDGGPVLRHAESVTSFHGCLRSQNRSLSCEQHATWIPRGTTRETDSRQLLTQLKGVRNDSAGNYHKHQGPKREEAYEDVQFE